MYSISRNKPKPVDSEVPESLDSVLNSLETLLEHRSRVVAEPVDEAMESFADSIGEQYDDPLFPEDDHVPVLQNTAADIPVLRDIVKPGVARDTQHVAEELDAALENLRSELDKLVEDILDDARDRFNDVLENTTVQEPASFADNISELMRDALARRNLDK